jgi:hypothetical protein
MWFFTKKIVYVGKFHEWINTKVHDFNMLDRVWVIRTISQSEYSHPHNPYKKNIESKSVEWIIVGTATWYIYSDIEKWNEINYEWWIADGTTTKNKVKYVFKKWYKVLLRDWKTIYAHTIKKSHWEFQEEIEYIETAEKKKIEVLAKQEEYRKSLEEMQVILESGKKMQSDMTWRLINAKF